MADRIAGVAFVHGRAIAEPDTLEFALWLAGVAPDTKTCRSVHVRTVEIDNAIEALAWKFSGRGKVDSLLDPFRVPAGIIRLKTGRRLHGSGVPPSPVVKERILDMAARGLVVGSALGLWRHRPSETSDIQVSKVSAVSPFPDRRTLVKALAGLQYGPDPAEPLVKSLERIPEAVLLERYRIHREERDLGAWMAGLDLTSEGERANLGF